MYCIHCVSKVAQQSHKLTCYFRIKESLYGEQLISLLFDQTQVGHYVVLIDP